MARDLRERLSHGTRGRRDKKLITYRENPFSRDINWGLVWVREERPCSRQHLYASESRYLAIRFSCASDGGWGWQGLAQKGKGDVTGIDFPFRVRTNAIACEGVVPCSSVPHL